MPRIYKRKLGAWRYKDCNSESIENALKKIIDEGWSIRKAAKIYKIPYGTLNNKYHGVTLKAVADNQFLVSMKKRQLLSVQLLADNGDFP